ncbi:MAG: hypothetical protein R2705_19600 [Ilumatobacteraceae bacterium]
MTTFNTDTSKQKAEEFTEPSAGPVPTAEEAAAAEHAAKDVDLESVESHYEEMIEKGANQKGEGKI